jgi:hypothetical protein
MTDKCKHDPNLKDTTLIKSSKYKMVNPQIYEFFCPCCKKVFKFGMNASGKYYEVACDPYSNK